MFAGRPLLFETCWLGLSVAFPSHYRLPEAGLRELSRGPGASPAKQRFRPGVNHLGRVLRGLLDASGGVLRNPPYEEVIDHGDVHCTHSVRPLVRGFR